MNQVCGCRCDRGELGADMSPCDMEYLVLLPCKVVWLHVEKTHSRREQREQVEKPLSSHRFPSFDEGSHSLIFGKLRSLSVEAQVVTRECVDHLQNECSSIEYVKGVRGRWGWWYSLGVDENRSYTNPHEVPSRKPTTMSTNHPRHEVSLSISC